MKISRPCYDKPHRCPGWIGGGMRYAEVNRCPTGTLINGIYDKQLWQWRFNRHLDCGLLVMPYAVRWVDWRWWGWRLTVVLRRVADCWRRPPRRRTEEPRTDA